MMKNSSMILSVIGASALAVISMSASVQAKKPGDWTCVDFLKGSDTERSVLFTGWKV